MERRNVMKVEKKLEGVGALEKICIDIPLRERGVWRGRARKMR